MGLCGLSFLTRTHLLYTPNDHKGKVVDMLLVVGVVNKVRSIERKKEKSENERERKNLHYKILILINLSMKAIMFEENNHLKSYTHTLLSRFIIVFGNNNLILILSSTRKRKRKKRAYIKKYFI